VIVAGAKAATLQHQQQLEGAAVFLMGWQSL